MGTRANPCGRQSYTGRNGIKYGDCSVISGRCTDLDWVQEQLAQIVAEPLLREAFTRLWCLCDAMKSAHDQHRAHLQVVIAQMVCQRLCPEWQAVYARVDQIRGTGGAGQQCGGVAEQCVADASGAASHVSQEMLDLKRLFWNCRPFATACGQGACPYELLGLKLPTDNWWKLLQMDPDVLRQKLSTQEVAA